MIDRPLIPDHVRARRRRAEALPSDARLVRYVAEPDGSAEATVRLGGQVPDVDPATGERRFGSDAGWYDATSAIQRDHSREFYAEERRRREREQRDTFGYPLPPETLEPRAEAA
jgi:hypothetical protein